VKKGHAKTKGEEKKRRGVATSFPVQYIQGNVVYQLGGCLSSCSQLLKEINKAPADINTGLRGHKSETPETKRRSGSRTLGNKKRFRK